MAIMANLKTKSTITAVSSCLINMQHRTSNAFPTPGCNVAFVRHHQSSTANRRYFSSTLSSFKNSLKYESLKWHRHSQFFMSDKDNNAERNATTDPFTNEDDFGFMDLDEADELFFNSLTIHNADDGYIEENADELMQLLQEMMDSNNTAVIDIDDDDFAEMDEDTLMEILGYDSEEDEEEMLTPDNEYTERSVILNNLKKTNDRGMRDLEHALMQGVVPADAGVGSGILPGDIGFDPLELSTKDYFKQVQTFILNLLPERKIQLDNEDESEISSGGAALPINGFVGEEERPPALILRDYREAEIRHGRLAMLAAAIWPLQEIIDRIFMPETFGDFTVVYGGATLPFLPLLMTFMMLNLGYLDIYSSEIKENESGDAFLPGECFWDPLCMIEGASDQMKRNMQEREILNGRAAMIAVAAFTFEEAMTHRPVITIGRNDLLFEPVYQIPFIQAYLDQQFGSVGETIMIQ